MSRLLSELLNAEEPLFSMAIKQLEVSSGGASIDVRLTAEIVGKVHMKLRALGLDPKDTTGPELYSALFNLLKQHDVFLAKRIGVDDPEDIQAVLLRVSQVAKALDLPKKAWLLKQSVAKRLLKQTPPKHVMKQLGYRSIDSMIKRESVCEIYAAMRFLESKEWLDKFIAKYKHLKPGDFETREIEVIHMDVKKWGSAAMPYVEETRQNITHLKEVGVVAIMPLPLERSAGITIITLPLVLHYINEIRIYSSFFKSRQIRSDFAETIIETLISDPGKHAHIGGRHIHWRVIHRHFGSDGVETPDVFEPHVDSDDLIWRKTEETLYRLEPALHFWYDAEYVGVMFDGRPISFNLMDMAVSFVNNLHYGQQSVRHMRDSIWNELYIRYIREEAVEKQIVKQLEHSGPEMDIVALGLKGNI